jgi:exopolysaccharide biosynthesis predicted pyruvyltransferase EpsI
MRLISAGRVVVTDRLHGHILCLLLGLPHVLLDNAYGKISNFHRMWTDGVSDVVWAESPENALDLALRIADSAR